MSLIDLIVNLALQAERDGGEKANISQIVVSRRLFHVLMQQMEKHSPGFNWTHWWSVDDDGHETITLTTHKTTINITRQDLA